MSHSDPLADPASLDAELLPEKLAAAEEFRRDMEGDPENNLCERVRALEGAVCNLGKQIGYLSKRVRESGSIL